MKIIGLIPARYESSRFVGKPLADICGKPMIWWVYQQAMKVEAFDAAYVTTDDERIVQYCTENDMPVLMTSVEHRNGTERNAEAAAMVQADIYVTMQGDEPLLEPSLVMVAIEALLANDKSECEMLKTKFKDPVDVVNATTAKVCCDNEGNAMLISRCPIPYPKAALNYSYYKSMGVCAFRREALLRYNELTYGEIERAEEIEFLRFLENGINIHFTEVDSETIAVDTPKDLARVVDIIKARQMAE